MTPEAARDKKLGVKMQTLRVNPAQEIPKAQKEGVTNGPQKLPKIQIGDHFCKMCTYMYDPMSPSSATPVRWTPL